MIWTQLKIGSQYYDAETFYKYCAYVHLSKVAYSSPFSYECYVLVLVVG